MASILRPEKFPTPRNPRFRELVHKKLKGQHFMREVGIHLDEIEPGYVSASMELQPRHLQQDGNAHGGVIMTLLDVAMGFAAFTLVDPHQHVVSGQMDVHFLRPGRSQRLWAEGHVIKAGRRLSFCEGQVWAVGAGTRQLIAKAQSIMVIFVPGQPNQ